MDARWAGLAHTAGSEIRDEANTDDRDAAFIAGAMAQTDTTGFAGRSFATLSCGEQTRVSVAQVIAQATAIILLDEPTTVLDMANQERIMSRGAVVADGSQREVLRADLLTAVYD